MVRVCSIRKGKVVTPDSLAVIIVCAFACLAWILGVFRARRQLQARGIQMRVRHSDQPLLYIDEMTGSARHWLNVETALAYPTASRVARGVAGAGAAASSGTGGSASGFPTPWCTGPLLSAEARWRRCAPGARVRALPWMRGRIGRCPCSLLHSIATGFVDRRRSYARCGRRHSGA